jgi:hypothetical protein
MKHNIVFFFGLSVPFLTLPTSLLRGFSCFLVLLPVSSESDLATASAPTRIALVTYCAKFPSSQNLTNFIGTAVIEMIRLKGTHHQGYSKRPIVGTRGVSNGPLLYS